MTTMSEGAPEATAEELAALAQSAIAGEPRAFASLALALWPLVVVAARRRAARAADADDEAQELYARLLVRLESEGFKALRAFEDWSSRHPEKDFVDWLRIVMANLSRDRQREQVGRRRDGGELPSAKRLLNELAELAPLDDVAYRPRVTSRETAREILQFAATHLPPLQAAALAAWIEGESFEDVRDKTGAPDQAAAVRLVRAALATLRRQFAG
jgi:DNA-directed RNA polymerase specialized sigma24 family protein